MAKKKLTLREKIAVRICKKQLEKLMAHAGNLRAAEEQYGEEEFVAIIIEERDRDELRRWVENLEGFLRKLDPYPASALNHRVFKDLPWLRGFVRRVRVAIEEENQ